jgi:WD40 repeat protein
MSYDKTLKLWDMKTKSCIATLKSKIELKNGDIVSGFWDKTVRVWDMLNITRDWFSKKNNLKFFYQLIKVAINYSSHFIF